MNENERKKTRERKIPWDEVRLAYETRTEKPSYSRLSREFGAPVSTISSRASRENWVGEREKFQNKVRTSALDQIGRKRMINLTESMMVLDEMLNKLMSKTDTVKPSSLEGLSREIRETVKMLVLYLHRPAEQPEFTEEENKKLSVILSGIRAKAPEEYEQMKEIIGAGDDGGWQARKNRHPAP